MSKLLIRNKASGAIGDYEIVTPVSNVLTEVTIASAAEVSAGTSGAVLASPHSIAGSSPTVVAQTISAGVLTQSQTVTTAAIGTVRGVHGQVTTSHAAIASGNATGTRGLVTLSGANSAGGAYFYGAQGKLVITGTMNHADSRLCAAIAQLDATGGTLTAGQLSGLWIDIGGVTGAGGGQFNAIRITSNATAVPASLIYAQSDASFVFDIVTPTGATLDYFATAGTGASSAGVTTGGVAAKVLLVRVDGTTYYLPLFSSNAS